MESIFFTIRGELRTLCTLRRARCRFEVVQKDLMDMLVRELKEEAGAGGARSAQDRQQGMATPVAARRDRARASGNEREP